MHQLKEELIDLFDSAKNWNEGLIKISEWMETTQHYVLKAVKRFGVGLAKSLLISIAEPPRKLLRG